ncbi:MAG: hypothetical protein IT562_12150 [Alphaproteobacteria bacterium]|nr:hypothetical protein [Alphaproteobacteria bacterium]
MVLYPASSLHRVQPVTRGQWLGCFFWIQSMVRDDAHRTLLFDLDQAIQQLSRATADPLRARSSFRRAPTGPIASAWRRPVIAMARRQSSPLSTHGRAS